MQAESITGQLAHHYNRLFTRFGPSFSALQWHSVYTQQKRYDVLLQDLPPSISTLCDIGCGCGDLFHFIKQQRLNLNYTGIDVSANMVVAAQRAYPSGTFRCLELRDILPNHTFDLVVASGIFNNQNPNHLNQLINTVKDMITLAKYEVRFNVLSHRTVKKEKTLVYTNPDDVIPLLRPHANSIELVDGYLPNDVSFVIQK